MAVRPVSLFSGLALKDVLEESVLPAFTREHDYDVHTTFEPTKVLAEHIAQGARPDVMVGVGSALEQLAADGVLEPTSLSPMVRSGIGLAVHGKAAVPPVDTIDELVSVLCGARSVAYSRTGASGEHFASLIDRLGIAEEVNQRATILDSGFTGEALVDGRADVAVQQTVELAAVAGVRIVGPLPADAQHFIDLWAGVGRASHQPTVARRLFEFLLSSIAAEAYRAAGLQTTVDGHPVRN